MFHLEAQAWDRDTGSPRIADMKKEKAKRFLHVSLELCMDLYSNGTLSILNKFVYTGHTKKNINTNHPNGHIGNRMKTLKISEDIHQKLTSLLGELMSQTSRMQTYQDAINALINESVILPQELLTQTQIFVEENKQLGYTTKEEFIRDAIRFRLTWLNKEYEYIEIPKEQYDTLEEALKEMDTPYRSVEDFMNTQMKEGLQKYEDWKKAGHKRLRKD
jgi:hypothetical protein